MLELRDDLEALLDAIWVKGVIDTEQPLEVRHRAVLVHFHVRHLFRTIEPSDL